MAIARLRLFAIILAASAGLAACVTTEVGRVPSEPEEEEAARYNMQLGVEYFRQNKLDLAKQKLEKALEQDPGLAAAHTTMALLYDRIGDRKEAEKHYRRAVRLSPKDADALNALGIFLCSDENRRDEALETLDAALAEQLYPRRTMLFTNAGVCARQFDGDRAEAYFRAALGLDPNYSGALVQLADLSFERGLGLQARAFIERYLATGQVSADILWLGIKVENELGDMRAARRYTDRLLKEFPDSVPARAILEGDSDV
jgi:type IV pilus assembly protein PilF